MREPETIGDAHVLLKRLRKRRDLLANIADEIDELLASQGGVSTPPTHSLEPELPAQKLPHTAQLQGKKEDFEPKKRVSQKEQEKSVEKPNVNVSELAQLPNKNEKERRESRTNFEDTDTSLPLSRYKLSSLVKPAFMLLCGLSLIFFIITIVNFGNRDSGLEGLSTNIETDFESPMFPDLRKLDANIERQKQLLESQPSEVETRKLRRMVEERDEIKRIIDQYNETAKNMIEGIGSSSNIK